MKKTKRNWFAAVSLAAGALFLCAVLILSGLAVRDTAGAYRTMLEADLSEPMSGTLNYIDRLYIQLGFGIEILPTDPDPEGMRADFLQDALTHIDRQILWGGVIYTMFCAVLLSYFLCARSGGDRRKH